MTEDDVDIVKKDAVYQGYFRIDRYILRHRRHDGGWSGEISREIFERGHAVAVLPYDPKRDEVVLLEQFRAGALAAGKRPWITEIVAGIIDGDEAPEEVARRESQEEAGLEISALWPVCRYLVSPGGTSETVTLYIGRTDSAGAGGLHGLDEEDEDIRSFVCSFDEALMAIDKGRIANAAAIIALQWLALHRDDVRAAWSG